MLAHLFTTKAGLQSAARVAAVVVLASSAAACTSSMINNNGLETRTLTTPLGSSVSTRMNMAAVHQSQIEILCTSPDGQLRKVGVTAVTLADGETAFRLQREQDLAEASALAGVARPTPARSPAGACALIGGTLAHQ